jgi:hypothetical protein
MVVLAEPELGIKLPVEYITLLRIQNGGYTQGFGYPMTQWTKPGGHYVPLIDLAGIVSDPAIRTAQNILDTAYLTEEWGLPPGQVILSGEGHWWITLDYRNGKIPSVTFLDLDFGQDIQVAPSFPAFLEGLQPISDLESKL